MEYISGNAFTYTQTLKIKNGYIVKYKVLSNIFVVHVQYLHSIHYHVFDILWHSCKNFDSMQQNMVLFLLI